MEHHPMIEEFLELTAISSPSLGERQMADVLKAKLQALGCTVTEDNAGALLGGTAGNLIARLPGDGRGTPLLLSAHMDRVPNGDGIRPVIGDGVITSDGTTILAADDLSGVCAILEGLRRLQQSGEAHGDLEIVFSVCEERKTGGSRNLDCSQFAARCCYCFDSPGHIGRIIRSAPTIVQLFVDVCGRAAHAGNAPETGVNALKAAARILADMEEGRLDFETTANWAIMKTENMRNTNVVCPHAQLVGEVRSRDPEKVERYISYVIRRCTQVLEDSEATFQFHTDNDLVGFSVEDTAPVLQHLQAVMADMAITPLVENGGGGMDANWFNLRGIPSIGVATGYANNHTADETLYLDDFLRSGELVHRLIRHFAQ